MWNVQEQEEYDYRLGCADELTNAYRRSQREIRIPNERDLAKKLLEAGSCVVIRTYDVFCPSTDAVIGMAYKVDAVCCDMVVAGKYLTKHGEEASEMDQGMWAMAPAAGDDLEFPVGVGLPDLEEDDIPF